MENKKILITKGDNNNKYYLGKFDTGYDINFEEIDNDWYIQTKPKDKEDETNKTKNNKYAQHSRYKYYNNGNRTPKDTIWFMNSKSGRYFREIIESNTTQYFYLKQNADGHFISYPIEEQHVFRPISKPKFAQSEEERIELMKRAKIRQDEKKALNSHINQIKIANDEPVRILTVANDDEDEKGEYMDYEFTYSDNEDGEITISQKKKKPISEEAKKLSEKAKDEDYKPSGTETSNTPSKSLLGKRIFEGEKNTPNPKKAKIGTELTNNNLYALLRENKKMTLKQIRKHFKKSGTSEEIKKFFLSAFSVCAQYDQRSKTFEPNPFYIQQ